jgi:hypothetical protein
MFIRSRDNNSTSSGGYWDEYNDASESSMERHRDPKHSRRTTARIREESYTKSLSAHPSDEEEDFVHETPEAALVAAQTYLLTTQPKPGDPREHMHQAAIRSLGLIENKLRGNPSEKKVTHHKERRKEEFKRKLSRNETSESSGDEKRQKTKGGRKEYNSTSKSKQLTLCVERRKLRGRRKRDGRVMLYPQGSQNAGTQRIQVAARSTKI